MEAIQHGFTPDMSPPALRYSVMELGRVLLEMGSSAALGPLLQRLPRGDGHTIMTLPGFMGGDGSTVQLRKFLNRQGYNAIPWGLGRNAAEPAGCKRNAAIERARVDEHELQSLRE